LGGQFAPLQVVNIFRRGWSIWSVVGGQFRPV